MRKSIPTTSVDFLSRSAALETLHDTAGLPPQVDFGQSFAAPPRIGEPSEAASDVRGRVRAMAEELNIPPAALRARPPALANTPSFLPTSPQSLVGSMPASGLPSELLDTPYEAKDERGDVHAFNLRDTLAQVGIGDVATPFPTPNAGAIWEGVQSADPQAFQMPAMPAMPASAGGTPLLNQINNMMGAGIGLAQSAGGIDRLLNGETSDRQGLADASAVVGALAGVLPPEAAKVVAQAAALTQSFAAIDPAHLSLGDASGLIDQVGNALGVPGLGQAAKAMQDMMDAPGGIEGAISDPMSVLNGLAGLDMLTSQLPPMAQAALGQAKAILGALKQLTTPVPGTVPPGIPGIYVENLMIATLGPLTQTVHGIPLLPGPGSIPTVLATALPVWRVGMDIHFCPIPQGIPPHGPGVVAVGAVRTFAQGGLIARHTDMVIEVLGGPTPIMPAPIATGGGADNEPDDYDEPQEPDDSDSDSDSNGGFGSDDSGDPDSPDGNDSKNNVDNANGSDADALGKGDPEDDEDDALTPVAAKTDPAAGTAFKDGNQRCVAYDSEVKCDGDRAWRNNNPGNIKYGPVAENNGAIGKDAQSFAIFPDEATGSNALSANLDRPYYQNKSIADAMKGYSPPFENDTEGYTNFIEDKTGIDPSKKVSALTPDERTQFENAIKTMEGSHPGTTRPRIAPPNSNKPVGI